MTLYPVTLRISLLYYCDEGFLATSGTRQIDPLQHTPNRFYFGIRKPKNNEYENLFRHECQLGFDIVFAGVLRRRLQARI